MKKKFLPLMAVAVGLCASSHATINYVKANATGLNNGTSWANAYTDLQTATTSSADTLWVANGIYKPTTTTTRTISFNFGNKQVFGGFVGGETLLSQRNYSTYQTILSGDIGTVGNNNDNSFHVVLISTGQGLLDGFKITDGNSSDAVPANGTGGGIRITGTPGITTRVNNCLFTDNLALSGGAISNISGADAFLVHCRFESNVATGSGGALLSGQTSSLGQTDVKDCVFYSNKALSGGGISFSGPMNIERCTFSGNQAVDTGGAIHITASPIRSTLIMGNSLIVGNIANYGSALYVSDDPNVQPVNYAGVRNCTFSGNKTISNSYALRFTIKSQLNNSIVWGNETGNSAQVNISYAAFNNIIQNSASGLNNTFAFDPLFANPGAAANAPFNAANYNYQLSDVSPAIERGLETLAPNDVFDLIQHDRKFGVNPDLGCYEKTYCVATPTGDIIVDGNTTTFCQGTAFSVKLTAPNGIAYNWSNNEVTDTTTVNTAGVYKVAVLEASGCRAIYSKEIVIAPLPVPVIALNNTTLTTGSFNSYQWIKDNVDISGATSQTYTPTVSGIYKVRVTNAAGCVGISLPFTFAVLGINETNDRSQVRMYPNPAKDRFTVDVSELKGKVLSYMICDIMGKRIIQENIATKAGTLEVLLPETIANGLYIFNLYAGEGTYSVKFSVRR